MRFFLSQIEKLGIRWNEVPLDEDDFYRVCRRFKITVDEFPLRTNGFYYKLLGGHYIVIDSKLPPQKKLFVMFHEFAHFLMHAPDSNVTANFHGVGEKTRKEIEADIFALCALIPRTWIEMRPLTELAEDEGIAENLLEERMRIFERHGI